MRERYENAKAYLEASSDPDYRCKPEAPDLKGSTIFGPPVVIEVSGLAKGLTNGEYPQIKADYPMPAWSQSPEAIEQRDHLDNLGRFEIIKTIKNG